MGKFLGGLNQMQGCECKDMIQLWDSLLSASTALGCGAGQKETWNLQSLGERRGSLCFHTCTMTDMGRWKHRCIFKQRNMVWIYFPVFYFLISGYHLLCSISPWSASFPLQSKCSRSAFRTMVMANVWLITKLLYFGMQLSWQQQP